jgi:hypothetical protein
MSHHFFSWRRKSKNSLNTCHMILTLEYPNANKVATASTQRDARTLRNSHGNQRYTFTGAAAVVSIVTCMLACGRWPLCHQSTSALAM